MTLLIGDLVLYGTSRPSIFLGWASVSEVLDLIPPAEVRVDAQVTGAHRWRVFFDVCTRKVWWLNSEQPDPCIVSTGIDRR